MLVADIFATIIIIIIKIRFRSFYKKIIISIGFLSMIDIFEKLFKRFPI